VLVANPNLLQPLLLWIVDLYSGMMMLLASFYYFFFCWIVYAAAFTSSSSFPKQSRLFSSSSPSSTSVSGTTKPHLQEGDRVPSVTFKARVRDDSVSQPNPYIWKDVTSDQLFLGKRCVLFALPGGITLFMSVVFSLVTVVI
jgi:hypothetical protein